MGELLIAHAPFQSLAWRPTQPSTSTLTSCAGEMSAKTGDGSLSFPKA